MKLFFFFIDGIGLGENNKNINPLISYMKYFNRTFGKTCFVNTGKIIENNIGFVKGIDACLGLEGLPQSATGQTALFTGVNASKVLGYHKTATPNKELTKIINEKSILKILKEKGFSVTSANAYSKQYFDKVKSGELRHSATTLNIIAAGLKFRYIQDLKIGNAVFMDITNQNLKQYGYDVKIITPKIAAKNMIEIIENHDLTLFEYFLTDYFGHLRGTMDDVKKILRHIDDFVKYLNKGLDLNKTTVLITSDHGNIENIKSKPHTRNPVPLIVFNKNSEIRKHFIKNVNSILDVTPAIINFFEKTNLA